MESRAHGAHEEHADRSVYVMCVQSAKGHLASPHLGPRYAPIVSTRPSHN